ncbi:inactive heparanase-2 isoform X5 [Elephas maximus indicus]|uniref:inactive heparanase-2 isoform X5 n=1 Tax=Elephas maximus indicus TaxID=99487 RepID=UPI0021166970|nr:inactive heparanase-2 isoform X5 [Elephas maximus indicus]
MLGSTSCLSFAKFSLRSSKAVLQTTLYSSTTFYSGVRGQGNICFISFLLCSGREVHLSISVNPGAGNWLCSTTKASRSEILSGFFQLSIQWFLSQSDVFRRSLDKLYNFADCSGLHLIFALNALRRNPNNSWNSSSALSLLKYSASKKYNISWELGNEPNNYRTMHGRAVNGSQLGKDYIQLKSLLQPIRIYSRASLYGPNIGRPRKNVIALLDGFMKVAGSTVDAVTWQHCYIDGRVVKVMDFLKTRLLDTLSDQIRKIQKVVNAYTPGKKIWLEGVVTTSAGGTNNLSDSYAAGFLWLNTLGMLANQGIDVVIRHSFFDYGYNHLVDQNFNPLPDYWLSLLYKRLIGPKVLAVHVAGLQRKPRPGRVIRDKLRIYAHCTNHHNHNYVRGSITLFIINLHRSRKKIKLAGTLRDKLVHQYLLQPYGQEGLKSKSVQLNGQPLVMVDDGTLPELKPRPLRAGRTLVIPPVTMGFYVVKNVNALACRYR